MGTRGPLMGTRDGHRSAPARTSAVSPRSQTPFVQHGASRLAAIGIVGINRDVDGSGACWASCVLSRGFKAYWWTKSTASGYYTTWEGDHYFNTDAQGGYMAHNNMQPTQFAGRPSHTVALGPRLEGSVKHDARHSGWLAACARGV